MIGLKIVRSVESTLLAAGIPDARFEAEVLVRHHYGLSRAQLFAGASVACDTPGLEGMVSRRCSREPLAYILGTREFMGHPFEVTPAVLIPRAETELLCELVIRRAQSGETVLDIGTGSGSIASSIAIDRPDLRVIGIDVSTGALKVASANAARLAAAVSFVRGSLATSISAADIIVANLPYIPSGDIAALEPEVRDGEPRLALDGGDDGLVLISALVSDCAERLRPRLLCLEVMAGQAPAVAALAEELGASTEVHMDLASVERVVVASWT